MFSITTGPARFGLATTTPPASCLQHRQQQAMQPMTLRTATTADAMMTILIARD